jgi:isopentenyl diphosphate isomerase/L-lactate dehydrogenase-like FMN-dependent dehydrogenase
MPDTPTIIQRKVDHIEVNLTRPVAFHSVTTGLESYQFIHEALSETALGDVALDTVFLGQAKVLAAFANERAEGEGHGTTPMRG